MFLAPLILLAFSVHSLAAPTSKRASQSLVYPGDAPYTVDTATLAKALTCPNGNPTEDAPPVLLVHGTGSTGEQSWGDGYVPVRKSCLGNNCRHINKSHVGTYS
jgi:triacylglycerol lipase